GTDLISGDIPGHDFYRGIHRPVVLQRKESKMQILAELISWKEVRTDLHSGCFDIVGNPINHTFRAALVDVMLTFENFQLWRFDAEREVLCNVGLIACKEISE